jgi:hypothetical protein
MTKKKNKSSITVGSPHQSAPSQQLEETAFSLLTADSQEEASQLVPPQNLNQHEP